MKELFRVKVELRLLRKDEDEGHCVFLLQFFQLNPGGSGIVTREHSTDSVGSRRCSALPVVPFSSHSHLSPVSFALLCPFFILFDRDLHIIQCGNSLIRLMPNILFRGGADAATGQQPFWRLIRPWITASFSGKTEFLIFRPGAFFFHPYSPVDITGQFENPF